MAEYLTNTTDLTKVASAIREKGSTSDPLVYPDGFVTAIQASRPSRRGVSRNMRELAAYHYDPEKYAEKVNERRDWSNAGRSYDEE